MIIGVSLKMYFGHAQTLDWCSTVATLATERPASSTRLFLLPSFPSLPGVADLLAGTGIAFGAQDLTADDAGAQTGEVGGGDAGRGGLPVRRGRSRGTADAVRRV